MKDEGRKGKKQGAREAVATEAILGPRLWDCAFLWWMPRDAGRAQLRLRLAHRAAAAERSASALRIASSVLSPGRAWRRRSGAVEERMLPTLRSQTMASDDRTLANRIRA